MVNRPSGFENASAYSGQRLSKDVKNESALLYTRHRDIHAIGIVLMQMLLGLDVTERYPDAYAAIRACELFFGRDKTSS
jgi:hypothetical protein